MKQRIILTFFTMTLVFLAVQAGADEHAVEVDAARGLIQFFNEKRPKAGNRPGPNCVLHGDVVWSKSLSNRPRDIRNEKCRSDRIRHVRLIGPIAAGTKIQVFNNGGASTTRPGDSSWAEIFLRSDLPTNQRIIIGSFEPFQANPAVIVRSACNMRRDGRRWCPWGNDEYLDGKISFIRVLPPRAQVDEAIPSIDEAYEQNTQEEPR